MIFPPANRELELGLDRRKTCRAFSEPILKSVHLPEVLKFGAFRCRNLKILYNLVISIEHFDEKVLF